MSTRTPWTLAVFFLGLSLLLIACGVATPEPPPPTPAPGLTPTPASASITGTVWQDLCLQSGGASGPNCVAAGDGSPRADGLHQAGEPGFGGIVVNLGLGCPAGLDITTTTTPDGTFSFTALPAGTYCLTVDPDLPANAALLAGQWTSPAVGEPHRPASHIVQVGAGETKSGVNFGRDSYWNDPTPTATASATPTVTATPTLTATASPTAILPTRTSTATATATRTPTATHTPAIVNWRGEYYGSRDFTGNPVVRDDAALDFNWGLGAPAAALPADGFAVRWTRSLHFNAGTYRFRALADDGVRLWLDEQLILNDWNDGGAGEVAAEVALAQGTHSLRVEYYEAGGLASFKLWWDVVGSPSYPDWKAEYWSNRAFNGAPALTRNDRAIDFDWGTGAPAVGLPSDDFAVRWSRWVTFEPGVYRFSARGDDGLRLYVDSRLIVDEWHGSDGARTYLADLALTGGPHSLLVEYDERSFRALVKVGWERLPATSTPTATSTSTATATPTLTATSTGTATPTVTATPTPTPTATASATATATQSPLESSLSGRVWRDVCQSTGQEWIGPGNLPAGCIIGGDSTLLANGLPEAGEVGIGGVLVTLTEGQCGSVSADPRSYTQTTDAEGRFTFGGLRPGSYCLVSSPAFPQNAPILLPGLWTQPRQTSPGILEAALTVTLSAGEARAGANLGWDFLNLP